MKTIIWENLRARRWFIFWWCLGIAAIVALSIGFYPSFRDQASDLDKSFQNIPETARAFISDTSDFLSPEGFLSSQVYYLMLPLLLSILAINLGSRLLAREEESRTLELLLARPISRSRLLAAKGLSGPIILLIVTLVALAAAVAVCAAVDIGVPLLRVVIASLWAGLMALLFGAVAFLSTTLGATARLTSIGIPVAIALAGYIVVSLSKVVEWLIWPARLLPYHYYQPGQVLSGFYDWWSILMLLLVIAVLAVWSGRAFRKRDID